MQDEVLVKLGITSMGDRIALRTYATGALDSDGEDKAESLLERVRSKMHKSERLRRRPLNFSSQMESPPAGVVLKNTTFQW